MIKYIQIENFKSLRKVGIPMNRLSLFFGMNGMGKSSVIQSMLLLRQSFWRNHNLGIERLYINGELIKLGTCKDIFCQNADNDQVRIFLSGSNNDEIDCKYQYLSDGMFNNIMKSRSVSTEKENMFYSKEPLFGVNFYYIGAEHIGPRQSYSMSLWDIHGINKLGNYGEYVVPYLALEGERHKVNEALRMEGARSDLLIDQLSAWMSVISPGIKLSASLMPAEEQAKLSISYAGERLSSDGFTPVNVGFGIPYVLPIVTALLISGENSLILIENPESHLHPKGQTRMAELIAKAVANGAQVICESHSDHIINGVRVAIKKRVLDHSDVSITYFDKNADQETLVTNIAIDRNGNMSDYPDGLLDEWGNMMSELI